MTPSRAGAVVRPLPGWYHVRLLPPAETTASGIVLPETFQENWNDGLVVAAGDDRPWPSGCRQLMWAAAGDRVLFKAEDLQVWGNDGREGFLDDRLVVGVIRGPIHLAVEPANEWVLVELPEREAPTGRILRTEASLRRPNCGRIRDVGPGLVRVSGPFSGTRLSVYDLARCFVPVPGGFLSTIWTGAKVHWDPQAFVYEVTGQSDYVEALLVNARDLVAVETP